MDALLRQEQQRLINVQAVITEQLQQMQEEETMRKNEVVTTRKYFWEDVKVNLDTFDDFLETIIGLRQETQALSVSQSNHKLTQQRINTLKRLQKSPYFGRIDLKEDDMPKQQSVYIGITSLMDEDEEDFLIYDWRAPVCSIYYENQPGQIQYQTPGGIVTGELLNKWQYLIEQGRLTSVFNTQVTIGDDVLQHVLSQGTNQYMQSIVATIQQEQNKVIRNETANLLIVNGTAGSGKTSAALQRVAYLLYKHREELTAEQIILFSPNELFNDYVSQVLPELGEQNMHQTTFQDYLMFRLHDEFTLETLYDQLEYTLTQQQDKHYDSRIASMIYKASTDFFNVVKNYIASLKDTGMCFKRIMFRGEVLVSEQEITQVFEQLEQTMALTTKLIQVQEIVIKKIKQIEKNMYEQDWVQDEIELLSNEDYHKARVYLAKQQGVYREQVADFEVEHDQLAKLIVQKKLTGLYRKIRALQFIDSKRIYKQLFIQPALAKKWGTPPANWESICTLTIEQMNNNALWYEDETPYLLLRELIYGFQKNRQIKHIFIDEAQDYSAFQFEFLKRLFPVAKLTILGDFNQGIFTHATNIDDFSWLSTLNTTAMEEVTLTRSYRSTRPIIEFTKQLLPHGQKIEAFNRSGAQPTITQVVDQSALHAQLIQHTIRLQQSGYKSIAIICQSAKESQTAYDELSQSLPFTLVKPHTMAYEETLVIIPVYLAKGIEFEAVLIYDAAAPIYSAAHHRLLYTACTRAMHELHIYHSAPVSEIVSRAVCTLNSN